MANTYTSGKHSISECDRCGFRYKLNVLKELVVRGKPTNVYVCPACYEGDHPQNLLGKYPVYDPQAVRNPRPDNSLSGDGSRDIQWGWNPVGGAQSNDSGLTPNALTLGIQLGSVTVTVT